MAMQPPKANPSKPSTSGMVDAWSDGKVTKPGHKAMAANGYRSGLHDGMRFVVEMIEAGHDMAYVIDRCRARITGIVDKPQDERAIYWLAKQDHIAEPATHSDRYAAQHLD